LQAGVVNRGFSSNTTLIELAHREHGIETFFAVHDTFFDNGKGLKTDWQDAWKATYTQIKPLISSGAIVGWVPPHTRIAHNAHVTHCWLARN
jgi:hypothetical protein